MNIFSKMLVEKNGRKKFSTLFLALILLDQKKFEVNLFPRKRNKSAFIDCILEKNPSQKLKLPFLFFFCFCSFSCIQVFLFS